MSTVVGLVWKSVLRTTHQPVEIGAGKVPAGLANRQATAVQPTYVPRTTTQKLILYMLSELKPVMYHSFVQIVKKSLEICVNDFAIRYLVIVP